MATALGQIVLWFSTLRKELMQGWAENMAEWEARGAKARQLVETLWQGDADWHTSLEKLLGRGPADWGNLQKQLEGREYTVAAIAAKLPLADIPGAPTTRKARDAERKGKLSALR